jgi:prolipoprotein diacylglyceryltransferase
VRFPHGTEAYIDHLQRGWIETGAAWSLAVHPVQLYASFVAVVMFGCLLRWRPAFDGGGLVMFAIMFGASRFVLEWLRGDFHPVLGLFSLPQAYSVALIAVGAIILLRRRPEQDSTVQPLASDVVRPATQESYAR